MTSLNSPRLKMTLPAALLAIVLGFTAPAECAASIGGLVAKGYLSLRYAYIGSSSPSTVYSGLRLTGSFELSALSNKIVLKYRSHHYFSLQRTKESVLESPFDNRHIFSTIYLELRGLLAKGLRVRLGRMFPELDYGSLMFIDGGWLAWDIGRFSLTASAGRTIDYWRGTPDDSNIQATAGLRYQTDGFHASVGFNSGEYYGLKKTEIPAGFYFQVGRNIWVDGYGSYDIEAKQLARAGLSLSWRVDKSNISLLASEWRNPFDQLYLADKNQNALYWGDYSSLPVTYKDVRLNFSTSGKSLGFRGSAGWTGGVRSGWLGNAYLLFSNLFGFQLSLGVQAMKTDFIEFYSADLSAQRQFGDILVQLQTQERYFQWRPRPSGFHDADNYTELSVEYPLLRHFYISLAGGGYFRKLGNENFKPQVELRVMYRI
jgi:hypothetical protein